MRKIKIKTKVLSLSEEQNALDYLEKTYHYVCQVEKSSIAWKWVFLTLHGALYGFAICALHWHNYERVTVKTKKGGEKLISFDEALNRCQDPKFMKVCVESSELQLSLKQKESIQKIKQIRNRLEHYIPLSWKIHLHGFPQVVMNVLDVIRFLALNTSNWLNFSDSQKKRIRSFIFQSKKILKQSRIYKETVLLENDKVELTNQLIISD